MLIAYLSVAIRIANSPRLRPMEKSVAGKQANLPGERQITPAAVGAEKKASLHVFTAAALALPGLLLAPGANVTAAEDDEIGLQYSHYQEGKREIYNQFKDGGGNGNVTSIIKPPNVLNPVEADSLRGSARINLGDRIQFAFNFTQDTWAGATPIATAPALAGAMNNVSNFVTTTVVGASPLARDSNINKFFRDKTGNLYIANTAFDPNTGITSYSQGKQVNQLTHILASASPETRRQGDFKFRYEWDNAAANIGGGESVENDYDSRFGNLGLRLDFNQKRTSVNLGLSYTNSDTHAILDPYSSLFVGIGPYGADGVKTSSTQADNHQIDTYYSPDTQGVLTVDSTLVKNRFGVTRAARYDHLLQGNRQDWSGEMGLTQVVNSNTQLELGLGYIHSTGYLSNPYKAVYVATANPLPDQDPNQPMLYSAQAQLEARPHERNQITGRFGLQYYLQPLDAGLHFNYSVARDDWGINAHTFSGDWVQALGNEWTVTPHVRYYSQSAADFYAPYFSAVQAVDPNTGENVDSSLNKVMPKYYSSDQRLSGFGALSGGVVVARQFAKGIRLETGFEYYSHQGNLKLGGGGEQAFADFDYWSANAALKVNLGALRFAAGAGDEAAHVGYHVQADSLPAGIMFGHALKQSGDMMLGYRYIRDEWAGGMLNGDARANADVLIAKACGNPACMMTPSHMAMNMHMLELMYAATDRLTLMLMPQWSDMEMNMDMLTGPNANMLGHSLARSSDNQQSGGIGDIGLYGLYKLFDNASQHLVLSVGGTAPTGDVKVMERRNAPSGYFGSEIPLDYSMQLGSGTWDLKPSLTYTGDFGDWSWGGQATATKRLQDKNQQGYALGDLFQSSVWGGYRWAEWLATTLRSVYTWQDRIRGHYKDISFYDHTLATYLQEKALSMHLGPTDLAGNYGGQYVDLGLGVNVTIPGGAFAGQSLKLEWLQPLYTRVNGYQPDRDYTLTATWGMHF